MKIKKDTTTKHLIKEIPKTVGWASWSQKEDLKFKRDGSYLKNIYVKYIYIFLDTYIYKHIYLAIDQLINGLIYISKHNARLPSATIQIPYPI